ncbi:ParB/RepB/Spo0J family partition protein [Miltoncostaea oceani]|uniref:ParB/RepB/Spo0J family partition protein n=1 Tax=Miltoncostaea oceani TaxID=2843216 RepID=UPI001C3DF002|nr:ParB/RepB/Spo0J family partition protein [Miltoncostaea oceani]
MDEPPNTDQLPVPATGEGTEITPVSQYPTGVESLMPVGADGVVATIDEEDEENLPDRQQPAEAPPDVRDIPIEDLFEIANIRPQYYGVEELSESMRVQGQLEPAMVRPAPPGATHDRPFELVFGYRRKRGAEMLGWNCLRCEVRDLSDAGILDVMITENLQREDLSAIAEAKAMKALVELGGLSQAAVARRLGVSASHVSHRLQLLTLSAPVIEQIDKGEISASHGEALACLPAAKQEAFANRAASGGVSVTKLSSWIRTAKQELEEEAPPDPEDLEPVGPEDATQIPHVVLRADLDEDDQTRMLVYVLLRSCNDQEMLEYLFETEGLGYEQIWDWVRGLDAEDARTLTGRLVRRYLEAGHRFSSLESSLVSDLGDGADPERRESYALTDLPAVSADRSGLGDLPDMGALPPAPEADDSWLPPAALGPAAESWGGDTSWTDELRVDEAAGEIVEPEIVEAETDDDGNFALAAEDEEPDADETGTDEGVEADEDDGSMPLSLAEELSDALAERQGLDPEKALDLGQRVENAGAPLVAIAEQWIASGSLPAAPLVAGFSPAGLLTQLGKPSLVFSSLIALVESTEAARARLEGLGVLTGEAQIVAALVSRQQVEPEKARGLVSRVAEHDQILEAALEWVEHEAFGSEPVIAGLNPTSLEARLGKPSLVLSALVALERDPEAALARLG